MFGFYDAFGGCACCFEFTLFLCKRKGLDVCGVVRFVFVCVCVFIFCFGLVGVGGGDGGAILLLPIVTATLERRWALVGFLVCFIL